MLQGVKSLRVFILSSLLIMGAALSAEKPNVVLVFIDDMGWGDLGCYGNDFIDSPRIDQLAKEGLRFTDFYASGAVCSPTRCAVQSGQNQARIGITAHIPGHWRPFERVITPQTTMVLPLDTITVAESLKEAGYRTGYVGKWHLGPGDQFGPDKQGYDFAAEINGPHLPGHFKTIRKDLPQPKKGQFRTDYEAELCEQFIADHKDEPFFLMLSPYQVHIPLASKSELVEKYRKRAEEQNRELPHPVYAAMVEEVDAQVGRVVDAIGKHGLTDRTMIIVTSDNGGLYRRYDYREHADDKVSSLAPLKGEKGSLHEGGIRIPMIVKWPGKVEAGTTSAVPAISHDFFPTFVEAAGASLPAHQSIDGVSLLSVFENPKAKLSRPALYWHYPHYHHDRPAGAIREGDWKLIEYLDGTGDVEIYHLAEDLSESRNLKDDRRGKLADLQAKLRAWRRKVIARTPIDNPSYDPERAHEWWSRRNGKPVNSDKRKRYPQTEKDL